MLDTDVSEEIIEYNKKLVQRFPFLKKDIHESFLNIKEYEFTWLDDLEPGWKSNFGIKLCEDLSKAIEEDHCKDTFEFVQIKEKFACLQLYATGYGEKTKEVFEKYKELSKYICGCCGNTATKITKGWIFPLCDICISDFNGDSSNIEDFYGFDSYEEVLDEIERLNN